MDRFRIEGGHPLRGRVRVSGAKNAVLPAMAAALLTPHGLRLSNVPRVRDVDTMLRVLQHMGVEVAERTDDACELVAARLDRTEAPYDLVRTMRASAMVLGPLVARSGRGRVSLPGGCSIGARPVDLHLRALRRLGADVTVAHGYIEATARQRLQGADFTFDTRTVTGTENVMMAACLARGRTVLRNCAQEPEIEDLAGLLGAMGARVDGAGTDTITIDGVDELGPASWTVIPDRIEAGTYAIAAAITRGDVVLDNVRLDHLATVLDKLRECGVQLDPAEASVRVRAAERLVSRDAVTRPHPGFPTDMQAQYMALMTQAHGVSVISETVFENRFLHVPELTRMGARISVEGHTAVVRGPARLSSAPVMASDLRASASLVLAGLAAEGATEIHRIYHIDRGYAEIVDKLGGLGARVTRLSG